MSFTKHFHLAPLRESIACTAFICLLTAVARAEDPTPNVQGNVDFDYADAPPAAVELDLSQGMFQDLFGIGDAAVAGIADALSQFAGAKQGAEGAKVTAEQLAAARQMVQIAGQVVQGVRVRIYQGVKEPSDKTDKLLAYYDNKLRADNWQPVLRAHDGNQMITLWAFRNSGAIEGLFIVAADKDSLLLTNVVCDISPEKVQKLTSAATQSALKAGLAQFLEVKMGKFRSPTSAAAKSTQP
jgi:hypothetical protein